MFRLPTIMLVLAVAVSGCSKDKAPEPPKFSEVMPNVPLPPQASIVSRSSGADAIQLTIRTPGQVDAVVAYYREVFKKHGWRLVNDAKDRDGAVVLFVEQNGPPLWVRIRTADDGNGTVVDLAGAKVTKKPDSTQTGTPPRKPNS